MSFCINYLNFLFSRMFKCVASSKGSSLSFVLAFASPDGGSEAWLLFVVQASGSAASMSSAAHPGAASLLCGNATATPTARTTPTSSTVRVSTRLSTTWLHPLLFILELSLQGSSVVVSTNSCKQLSDI